MKTLAHFTGLLGLISFFIGIVTRPVSALSGSIVLSGAILIAASLMALILFEIATVVGSVLIDIKDRLGKSQA